MQLKVLLPFRVFAEVGNVKRIVAYTSAGALGLLPLRLDFAAALPPGILVWETEGAGEVYTAVDEGVIVKTGADVLISVRNAIGGADLGQLKDAVEREFNHHDAQEQLARAALAKLSSGLIRRFVEFQHE